MIRVENWDKEKLYEMGKAIGEAFVAENDGMAQVVSREDLIHTYVILTEYYYNKGVLFASSENYEGFCVYMRKKERIKTKAYFHMAFRLLNELPMDAAMCVIRSGRPQYARMYKHLSDYVAIPMVVVRKEYQGQGFMRKLLEEPFRIAREEDMPCVLDTDTEIKVKKYTHCGMIKIKDYRMTRRIHISTMEYR